MRSIRFWCIRGFSDCLDKHLVGAQHGAKKQQGQNHRPRKFGGGERDTEESGQYHRGEPKDGVPLEQVFLFGVFHVLRCSGCCWFGFTERRENA